MSCFGSVCTNERALVIAAQNLAFVLIAFYRTVKEYNRDACRARLVNDRLRSVNGAGGYDIDYQQVAALNDRGVDLLVLRCLVGVAVEVLECDACVC